MCLNVNLKKGGIIITENAENYAKRVGKEHISESKWNDWDIFVTNTPNAYPYWNAVMFSLPILKMFSENESFEKISEAISNCSTHGSVRQLVSNVITQFSKKSEEFTDYLALKQ